MNSFAPLKNWILQTGDFIQLVKEDCAKIGLDMSDKEIGKSTFIVLNNLNKKYI